MHIKSFDAIKHRAVGPGGLYNCGNIIALVGGITIQSYSAGQAQSLVSTIWIYLFGSLGAGCLTLAMLVFLASGEAYHRAWRDQKTPIVTLNRLGDLLSGVGAVILTIALITFGDFKLALVAGSLLVVGKFGTAILPEQPNSSRNSLRISTTLRTMVVVSRLPSIVALGISFSEYTIKGGISSDAAMAVLMIGCHLLWLWADLLLVRGKRAATSKSNGLSKPVRS